MTTFIGPPPSATRNLPISPELRIVLDAAAQAAGVDTIRIVSGGQSGKGEGGQRTGSTRHDHGRAADIQLLVNGVAATFTDKAPDPIVAAFVTAAAANGATGIGAGVEYMGNQTIHVGFGTSINDKTKLTWGAGGLSANARFRHIVSMARQSMSAFMVLILFRPFRTPSVSLMGAGGDDIACQSSACAMGGASP